MGGGLSPFQADHHATPLTPEEADGLIAAHLATRRDLDELEFAHILAAGRWAFARRRTDLLTETFLLRLHGRMFGKIWRWAGAYRRTERNMGVPVWQVPIDIRHLLDDARFWIENATYPMDEIAVRFHHRLVSIHPFVNGNGRHSRVMADLILYQQRVQRFSWGSASLTKAGETRQCYIAALQQADAHDYRPLLAFARS